MQRWYRCWSGKKRLKKGIKKRRGTTNKWAGCSKIASNTSQLEIKKKLSK
jgi:hypothetical protein